MAYTEAQITELKAVEGLDLAKAKAFGEKHGISHRSVIAKARALDIPYKTQTTATKVVAKKSDVRRKTDIARSISELLDINLASLEKMTTPDLTALEVRAKEMVGA